MATTLIEDTVNRLIVNSPADHTAEEYSGNTDVSAINNILVHSRKENVKVFARVTATQEWETLGVVGNDLGAVSGHGEEHKGGWVYDITTNDRVSIISLGAETTARIVFNPSMSAGGLSTTGPAGPAGADGAAGAAGSDGAQGAAGADGSGLSTAHWNTTGPHILPIIDNTVDIGSAEKKIRDLFVSENSLWIGDTHKITVGGGKMKFRKRKTSTVPAAVTAASGDAGAALAHAGVATLADMKLEHWRDFMRTLPGQSEADVKDIFRSNPEDYEDDFEAGAGGGGSTATQTIVSDMAQDQITTLTVASGTTPIVQIYEDIVIPGAGSTELDVLRLHLDSNLTDSSTSAHTVTAVGNAAISTSEKKFGAGSTALDGSGDSLSVPHSEDFNFGAGDFTIETWIRFSSIANQGGSGYGIMSHGGWGMASADYPGWLIGWGQGGGGPHLKLHGSSGSNVGAAFQPSLNTWYHLAITRVSGTVNIFIDGTLSGSGTVSLGDTSRTLYVGRASDGGGSFNGHIDDIRMTKGLARYTANFTVPTEAHPDANTAGSTKTLNKTNDYEIEHASDTTVEVKKTSAGSADVKIRLI